MFEWRVEMYCKSGTRYFTYIVTVIADNAKQAMRKAIAAVDSSTAVLRIVTIQKLN